MHERVHCQELAPRSRDRGQDDYLDSPVATLNLRQSPYVISASASPAPAIGRPQPIPLDQLAARFRCRVTAVDIRG